ncbi:unnamed protein product [Clonostachys rosea]|uniref:Uncharacterized protein n=1 Tax=Bionectria ochroleuca TaxID=29856 RepID=A0ABY6V1Y6_BIOOC|nr:unnamed protein product [Clonostachys rosea]
MRFTEILAIATLGLAGSSSAFSSSGYGDLETRDDHELRVAYQRSLDGLETRQPARLKIGGILDSKKMEKLRKASKKKTSKPKKSKSTSKKAKKAKKTLKRPAGLKTGKGGNSGTSTAYGNGDGGSSTAYQNRRSIDLEARQPKHLKIGKAIKKPKKTTNSKKTSSSKKSNKSKKEKKTLKRPANLRTGEKGTFNEGPSTAYQNVGGASTAYD